MHSCHDNSKSFSWSGDFPRPRERLLGIRLLNHERIISTFSSRFTKNDKKLSVIIFWTVAWLNAWCCDASSVVFIVSIVASVNWLIPSGIFCKSRLSQTLNDFELGLFPFFRVGRREYQTWGLLFSRRIFAKSWSNIVKFGRTSYCSEESKISIEIINQRDNHVIWNKFWDL